MNLPELTLLEELVAAIVARGWTCHGGRGGGGYYFFFDRPGYWLRITKCSDGRLTATVKPESWKCGSWPRERYADHEQAPEFKGRGAVARAREYAEGLIRENQAWLGELGIELTSVAARRWTGTGHGGYVSEHPYSVQYRGFL